jgi:hypothetical protein
MRGTSIKPRLITSEHSLFTCLFFGAVSNRVNSLLSLLVVELRCKSAPLGVPVPLFAYPNSIA